MQFRLHGITPLTQAGLLRAQGLDAARFLHNQLSNDFALQGSDQARLAGYCSAKGRLLASFIGVKRAPDDILLVCSRDLLATTLKRLSMFVLRDKVTLSDASDTFLLYGLAGDALTECGVARDAPPWQCTTLGDASLISLYPADGCARALWLAPAGTPLPSGPLLQASQWQWGDVRAGVASVSAALVDALVPQMLNYESVGGINFKKGCYPGQEVVARSQFRGTLKRRTYLAHAPAAMTAGQSVFIATDDSQPCGVVVQAAQAPDGSFDALVSMQTSAFEAGDVRLGSADGVTLVLSAPPYPWLGDL